MAFSSENLIFWVTCRSDRHSKLVVTCLLEPIDDVGSKNFWPISAQHSRKPIVRNVQKTRKSHADFGHPLRKTTVTSRCVPRLGSNSQDTLIGTSSTHFLSQLKNFSSDPPTLKEGLPAVHNFDAYFYLELHRSATELRENSLYDDSWSFFMWTNSRFSNSIFKCNKQKIYAKKSQKVP